MKIHYAQCARRSALVTAFNLAFAGCLGKTRPTTVLPTASSDESTYPPFSGIDLPINNMAPYYVEGIGPALYINTSAGKYCVWLNDYELAAALDPTEGSVGFFDSMFQDMRGEQVIARLLEHDGQTSTIFNAVDTALEQAIWGRTNVVYSESAAHNFPGYVRPELATYLMAAGHLISTVYAETLGVIDVCDSCVDDPTCVSINIETTETDRVVSVEFQFKQIGRVVCFAKGVKTPWSCLLRSQKDRGILRVCNDYCPRTLLDLLDASMGLV